MFKTIKIQSFEADFILNDQDLFEDINARIRLKYQNADFSYRMKKIVHFHHIIYWLCIRKENEVINKADNALEKNADIVILLKNTKDHIWTYFKQIMWRHKKNETSMFALSIYAFSTIKGHCRCIRRTKASFEVVTRFNRCRNALLQNNKNAIAVINQHSSYKLLKFACFFIRDFFIKSLLKRISVIICTNRIDTDVLHYSQIF